jgi:hypothetical protein
MNGATSIRVHGCVVFAKVLNAEYILAASCPTPEMAQTVGSLMATGLGIKVETTSTSIVRVTVLK